MRDAITKRVSTRSFLDQDLSKTDIEFILSVIEKYQSVKGPFGNQFEFTFNLNNKSETNGKKIGTYGLLKNVPAFIGGVSNNTAESIVDFGYVFEHIILELTKKDYGTCWLGGTFKRNDYRKKLEDNQVIPAISPVGFSAKKRTLRDRALRTSAQSNNRLDDDILFHDYQHLKPLPKDLDIIVKQSLCLVKRAPSASNKQPWRLYVDGNTVHFYIERTPNYAKFMSYDIQLLDIGIALSHFDVGIRYFSKKPSYKKYSNAKEIPNQEYVISIDIK